jgi:hypothetical protein
MVKDDASTQSEACSTEPSDRMLWYVTPPTASELAFGIVCIIADIFGLISCVVNVYRDRNEWRIWGFVVIFAIITVGLSVAGTLWKLYPSAVPLEDPYDDTSSSDCKTANCWKVENFGIISLLVAIPDTLAAVTMFIVDMYTLPESWISFFVGFVWKSISISVSFAWIVSEVTNFPPDVTWKARIFVIGACAVNSISLCMCACFFLCCRVFPCLSCCYSMVKGRRETEMEEDRA